MAQCLWRALQLKYSDFLQGQITTKNVTFSLFNTSGQIYLSIFSHGKSPFPPSSLVMCCSASIQHWPQLVSGLWSLLFPSSTPLEVRQWGLTDKQLQQWRKITRMLEKIKVLIGFLELVIEDGGTELPNSRKQANLNRLFHGNLAKWEA
uniref:Uncharacterized protein n=1 Tax=Arundo donax TaxID=35708 RepID=A0A0A9TGT5_ARUDO